MVNGSSIFPERIRIADERGIRRGIREKGGKRLSTDDLTIKANIWSEQCSVYHEWVKHLKFPERIEIAEERGTHGIREKGGNRLSADDSTIKANDSSDC